MRIIKSLLLATMFIALTACGGGGSGSGGSTAGVPNPVNPGNPIIPVPSASDSEGSVQSPVLVAIDSPRSSKVAGATGLTAPSYYKFTTGAAGTYSIGLTNTNQWLSWDLYSDATFTTKIVTCDNYIGFGDAVGLVELQAGTYYLKVTNWFFSADAYTLTVSYINNEGTKGTPVDLTVGVAHSGTIAANGKSYYRFKTTKAGAFTLAYSKMQTSATGWYKIGINVYQNPDFTGLLASADPQYIENCVANGLLSNADYYVEVTQNVNNGILYNLTVAEGVSDGSIASPVALSLSVPRNGSIDGYGSSYYSFKTTAAGAYILNIGTVAPIANKLVSIYSSPDFSTGFVTNFYVTSGQATTISGLDAAKQYYVRIDNQFSSVVTYSMTVSSGTTEGSVDNPVLLTVGLTRPANVDLDGIAYYYFKTNTSGTYTVNLSSSQNVKWDLYSDSGYTKAIYTLGAYTSSCSTSSASGGNCITTNLDAGVNYYLKVTGSSSSAASYTIVVNGAIGSEGSIANPIVLTEGVSKPGTVAGAVNSFDSYSYYKFTAGSSRPYMIMVTNVLSGGQNDIEWDMYNTPDFSSIPVAGVYNISGMKTFAGDAVAATSEFTPAVTITAGTTYYIRVSNWNASNNAYNIEVLPYDSAAGCNTGGTCINFETNPTLNLNPLTPIQNTALSAWAIDATHSATGTSSFKAGYTTPAGSNKFPTYDSCFEIQGTDVKWLDFSLATQANGIDAFWFYLDGKSSSSNQWSGATAWTRLPVRVETNGLHTFEWCYFKNDTSLNNGTAWIDDISLHY